MPLLSSTKFPNVFEFISRFSTRFHSSVCLLLSCYHIISVSSSITYMNLISGNLASPLSKFPCLFPLWRELWRGPVTRWFDYLLLHWQILRSKIFPLVSAYLWLLQGITGLLVMNEYSTLWSAFLVFSVLPGLWEEGLDRLFAAELWLGPRFSWLWFRIYHYYYCYDDDLLLFLLMSSSPTPTAPIKTQCTRRCAKYFWYIVLLVFTRHPEEVECAALSTPSCWWSLRVHLTLKHVPFIGRFPALTRSPGMQTS